MAVTVVKIKDVCFTGLAQSASGPEEEAAFIFRRSSGYAVHFGDNKFAFDFADGKTNAGLVNDGGGAVIRDVKSQRALAVDISHSHGSTPKAMYQTGVLFFSEVCMTIID